MRLIAQRRGGGGVPATILWLLLAIAGAIVVMGTVIAVRVVPDGEPIADGPGSPPGWILTEAPLSAVTEADKPEPGLTTAPDATPAPSHVQAVLDALGGSVDQPTNPLDRLLERAEDEPAGPAHPPGRPGSEAPGEPTPPRVAPSVPPDPQSGPPDVGVVPGARPFAIHGSVTGILRGQTTDLVLTLTNPNPFQITITALSAQPGEVPVGCSTTSGAHPISVEPLDPTAQAVSVAGHATAAAVLRITLHPEASHGCQGQRFPLAYTGQGTRS